jgi:hypothetical protein
VLMYACMHTRFHPVVHRVLVHPVLSQDIIILILAYAMQLTHCAAG